MEKLRVFIACGNREGCGVLRDLINGFRGMTCCGTALSGAASREAVYRLRPDVLLVTRSLKDGDGASLCDAVRQICPSAAVILCDDTRGNGKPLQTKADLVVRCPCPASALFSALLSVSGKSVAPQRAVPASAVISLLSELGFDPTVSGFTYLVKLVTAASASASRFSAGCLCKKVADDLCSTQSAVESSSRLSLRTAFLESPSRFASIGVFSIPSLTEFIVTALTVCRSHGADLVG